MNTVFSFPEDEGKAPLFSAETTPSEKDYSELVKNSFMKTTGAKLQAFMGLALCIMFFGYVTAMAFFSGIFGAAALYGAITLLLALVPTFLRLYAKRLSAAYPNGQPREHRFFSHHFTCGSEHYAASFSYDDVLRAAETDRAFLIYFRGYPSEIISKAELDKAQSEKLRTVMRVKLGSKFRVNYL